jgi:hypothetical protein
MGVPCKTQHLTLAKFIMGVPNKGVLNSTDFFYEHID